MQKFSQIQSQKQIMRMSQRQIQAVSMLAMSVTDLRDEIYKAVSDNPALEIVRDPLKTSAEYYEKKSSSSEALQFALDSAHSEKETLQHHLMDQLNLQKVTKDEYDLCQRLIYNLDKNGFYGSKLSPETLIDKNNPRQNKIMLQKCLERIQKMDPVGICCKNYEESLFIQAKLNGNASDLTLFILDGNLSIFDPPDPAKIEKKLNDYKENWHKKSFASEILLDKVYICQEEIEETLDYIRHLNPFPAANFDTDTSMVDFQKPDVVVTVEKVKGKLFDDDFSTGRVTGGEDYYFQVKYASGILPEVRIAPDMKDDRDNVEKAKAFLSNLEFCKSTIVLQTCAIINFQKDFFQNGEGNVKPLTRKQIAEYLGLSESTISRSASKKSSKYLQTEWGLFPFSKFFDSGVKSSDGEEKISSQKITELIEKLIKNSKGPISDMALTTKLNKMGIKIARRTVTKYRQRAGINNSYLR